VKIVWHTVAPLLVLPCTACGLGRDPFASPSVGSAGSAAMFPRYRLVGYAGVTGASTLGRLGIGPLDKRVAEIEGQAKPYAAGGKSCRW
jgi:hypothetical protein